MDFESLKMFFNNELTLNIEVNKQISSPYIKFNLIEETGVITFTGLDNNDSNLYICKISVNDALKLNNFIDNSRDYFAKVLKQTNNNCIVSIVNFNKLPLLVPMDVGIGDISFNFTEAVKDLEDYILDICGVKYCVYGKHKNASDNVFSLVNAHSKYDVILSKRSECGAVLDNSIANEQIWAIRKNSSKYKLDDYTYEIVPFGLNFMDISSAAAATEQNKLYVKNSGEGNILYRWKQFTIQDYALSIEKINSIGPIKYSEYFKDEQGKIHFVINGGYTRLNKLREELNTFGTGLKFEVFGSLDNIDNNDKNKLLVDNNKILGNEIICAKENDAALPSSGYLIIYNGGSKAIFDRRMEAIDRIETGKAAKQNITSLIEGRPLRNKDNKKWFKVEKYKKEIKEAFKNNLPDKRQLEAIEIAINTPDFAIIQGPPGCGKTSLINAIDNCLNTIDSTYHKKSSSLSTAYQRESTKNMIKSKLINGVPVPFVSNSESKIYIEDTFITYINEIKNKLENKYPDLVKTINEESIADKLTYLMGRFDEKTATYETLLSFIDDVLYCIQGSDFYSEIEDLKSIEEIVLNKRKKILKPIRSQSLYFIRIIPSSKIEYEDCGQRTFLVAKTYLLISNPELEKLLSLIESEYNQTLINFDKIRIIKDEMIFSLKNQKQIDTNIEINKKAIKLVRSIRDKLVKLDVKDDKNVIKKYVEIFMHNPVMVRQALEEWVTSVAATHQLSSDKKAINQNDSGKYVEYNNVLIDEAARSCPPDLLIPLACAKNRIIMVGDQEQLPQFINDEVLKDIEMEEQTKKEMKEVSIFEYLISTTKKLEEADGFTRFIPLNNQYRMPKILGDFISDNFYPEIGIGSPRGNPCDDSNFIQTMPYIANKCMVWCDVTHGKEEKVNNKGWKNTEEAKSVASFVKKILDDNKNENLTVGVISFYKDQVKSIIDLLYKEDVYIMQDDGVLVMNKKYEKRLMVDTVDAFQGLQCDIIILSMVRSDPSRKFKKNTFGFLQDSRHLCVALSRQQRCLVVFGNGSGMLETTTASSSVKPLVNFYNKCKEGGEYVKFIKSKDLV